MDITHHSSKSDESGSLVLTFLIHIGVGQFMSKQWTLNRRKSTTLCFLHSMITVTFYPYCILIFRIIKEGHTIP